MTDYAVGVLLQELKGTNITQRLDVVIVHGANSQTEALGSAIDELKTAYPSKVVALYDVTEIKNPNGRDEEK